MRTFDLEVASLRGSWVIKLDGRVVSGSSTLAGADRVARYAADSLVRSGFGVRLSTEGEAALSQDARR